MADSSISGTVVRNTLSNYLRTVVAMISGLITFRLLYGYFGKEEFGFWALLWSLFGIGVIFDFGLGFAAQKRVAELAVSRSWMELSRILSTIISFYTIIAIILPLVIWASAHFWIGSIGIPEGRTAEFRLALGLFFAGVSLSFPLGVFPEILRGQQRIHIVNWLVILAVSVRLILVAVGVTQGWSFTAILVGAIATTLAPDFLAAFFAFQKLSGVKLSPRLVSFGTLREISRFSVFAYAGTVITLLLSRTDHLVITTTLGVGAIVLYQAGAKIAEMFRDFTRQLQDALSPAAASLHAGGDTRGLQGLVVEGTRWSSLLSTPLYLICSFHLEGLITMLTGDSALARETWLIGQILLFWYYTSILTHSVSRRVFMMTGHERRLTKLGFFEAAANIVLSIGLIIWTQSIVGVVIGSLLPTLWFGWRHYWPWMAKTAGESSLSFFQETVLPAWLAAIPVLVALVFIQIVVPSAAQTHWLTMLSAGASAGILSLIGIWNLALHDSERSKFSSAIRKRLPLPVS